MIELAVCACIFGAGIKAALGGGNSRNSLTFIGYEEDKTFPCSYANVYGDKWNGTS